MQSLTDTANDEIKLCELMVDKYFRANKVSSKSFPPKVFSLIEYSLEKCYMIFATFFATLIFVTLQRNSPFKLSFLED